MTRPTAAGMLFAAMDPPSHSQSEPPPIHRWAWALAVFFVALLPIWTWLGGLPLTPRSDGRYAAVSMDMAQNDHWLVPQLEGEAHLTKPPLTYWAEAASIKLFGPTELAVRLPSAVAGSLVILLVLVLCWRLYGAPVGMLAAAVLAIMPLHYVISRLTLTDALLNLFWFGSLIGAMMAVRRPGTLRWPLLLWMCVALGWLTKPLAPWGAVGIAVAWLVLARRGREVWRLWPITGGILSLAPIAVWFWLVWQSTPDILEVWEREVAARAAGGGRHDEPVWFFLPVFLAGMFPATAMLELPALNHRFEAIGRRIDAATDGSFWAMAMVLPIVAFSIPQGKLPTYILPAAAPAAILTAMMLNRWLLGDHDDPPPQYNPPDVRITMMLVLCVLGIGAAVAGFVVLDGGLWLITLPALLLVPAGLYQWRVWREPQKRVRGMAVVWIALVGAYVYINAMGTHLMRPTGGAALVEAIRGETGLFMPNVVTYGYTDYAQSFYWKQWAPSIEHRDRMRELVNTEGRNLIVIADGKRWGMWADQHEQLADRFERVLTWQYWPSDRECLVMRPREDR